MLRLLEILQTKNITLGSYKVHLATKTRNAPSPLDAFFEGKFKRWQEEQNAKNFKCDTILSLISLDNDLWLFAGVYKVIGVTQGTAAGFIYQTELLPDQDDLIGRVIIRYQREFRNSYVWGHRYGMLLEVAEIRSQRMSIREFPGFNKVIVSYRELRFIVSQQEPGWKSALQSVQGIYLISDISNGKHYVGSTYGTSSIWDRWGNYVSNGHGGNTELEKLIHSQGINYSENFQFSVLEIADLYVSKDVLINRENYWKEALLTRRHGYNAN